MPGAGLVAQLSPVAPAARSVRLKQTTDVSLLTAFGEEQWINAANLARQRHKATKDPYFLLGLSVA
ncbi:hypothetical protein GGS23DRAFT_315256 [Durotheca rogersii]|uniref:uncharacterized protein n=1 Tax=Durotheca rogersii TaxID=419775 RepID=UPI0022211CCE|nr:uncharacterized protein GGS23DRAFT_315256 [Durotheca rogersii]KAI5859612.1 hypothetical protein GGS23DRAFT_315256 [Durotheca rogersii]